MFAWKSRLREDHRQQGYEEQSLRLFDVGLAQWSCSAQKPCSDEKQTCYAWMGVLGHTWTDQVLDRCCLQPVEDFLLEGDDRGVLKNQEPSDDEETSQEKGTRTYH